VSAQIQDPKYIKFSSEFTLEILSSSIPDKKDKPGLTV